MDVLPRRIPLVHVLVQRHQIVYELPHPGWVEHQKVIGTGPHGKLEHLLVEQVSYGDSHDFEIDPKHIFEPLGPVSPGDLKVTGMENHGDCGPLIPFHRLRSVGDSG
jgi:hypothetical protein